MSPDNNRSDDYWMGVRDALRMVDSFIRWSSVNEDRAKPIQEFIHDGLVAAAKRCESCLHKELGVEFNRDESEDVLEDTIIDDSDFEDDDIEDEVNDDVTETHEDIDFTEDDSHESSFDSSPPEIVLEPEGSDDTEDVPITIEPETEEGFPLDDPVDDATIHIESMGMQDRSLDGDTHVAGEKRDFTTDFRLVEPDLLEIKDTAKDTEDEVPSDVVSFEDTSTTPPVVVEEPSFHLPSVQPEDSSESDNTEDSDDHKKPWSPMDEPSSDDLEDSDEEEVEDTGETPPPPPPPPETEESEEERRRRARRLFFGG